MTIVPYCSANTAHAIGSIHSRREAMTSPDQIIQLPR